MKSTTILPAFFSVVYSAFIYLTYLRPEVLWAMHDRDRPMDAVWTYAVKAKGAAIAGLWVGLVLSLRQPLADRRLTYISCAVFHLLADLHHGWCFWTETPEFFVESEL